MIKFNVRGGACDTTKPNLDVRPQDNLYLAVNSKWMKETTIPADRPWIGSFDQVEDNTRKHLLEDLNDFADGKKSLPEINNLNKVVEFYKIARNAQKREEDGADPIQADLDFLINLNSLDDVNNNLKKLLVDFILPFNLEVGPDFKNAELNVVFFNRHNPILGETDNYEKDNAEELLGIWEKQTAHLLTMTGVNAEDAKQYAQNAVKLDKRLTKVYRSAEFNSHLENIYNPISVEEFEKKGANINLKKLLQDCDLDSSKHIVVQETKYLDNFDNLFNDEKFAELKGWLISVFINYASTFLSHDFRKASMPLITAMYGIDSISTDERFAYDQTKKVFSDVLGQYYGRTYLGEEAKADATEIVKNMMAVYKERLHNNTWLTDATKKEAIKKLDTLKLKIGYPDHAQGFYDQFKVISAADGGNMYENIKTNDRIRTEDSFEKIKHPVDHSIWAFSPIVSNACYEPSCNDITLPAIILQKPFYDLHQDRASNYGGFGTVIGHEISHAFDNNGAQFDELGNMKNWWAKEDFEEFNKRIEAEIKLFDGVEVGEAKVNGKLTVSENIGDQGGVTVSVEANKKEGGDAKTLFENYARIWETNSKPEFYQLLASIDVHALAPTRVNVQVQCQDEFYKAFDVKPGDGMWLDEDKRVKIW